MILNKVKAGFSVSIADLKVCKYNCGVHRQLLHFAYYFTLRTNKRKYEWEFVCLCLLVGKKTSIRLYRPLILWKDPLSKREPRQSLLGASVRKIRLTHRGIKLRLSSILVSNAFSLSLALY